MNSTSTKRHVVIYCRYSTDMQREESCEDQERECRRHLRQLEIDDTEAVVFHDSAVSGLKEDREGYSKVINMIEAMQIDVLVVDEQSRLSRGHNVSAVITDLRFGGGRFLSVNEGIDTEREGWQELVGFGAVRHSMSSTDTARRIRRGQIGRLHSKNGVSGSFPFGFRSRYVDDDFLEQLKHGRRPHKELYISEPEAEEVRWLFQAILAGLSFAQIARILNDRGVPKGYKSLNGTWNQSTIAIMVRNRAYIGEWTYGKTKRLRDSKGRIRYLQRKPGEYELTNRPHLRIIDDETWSSVQSILEGRKLGRSAYGKGNCHPKHEFPTTNMSGLIHCKECGRRMRIAGDAKGRMLRCDNNRIGSCKMHRHVPVKKIQGALLGHLASIVRQQSGWVLAVTDAAKEAVAK